MVRHVITSNPDAVKGTELDPAALRNRRDKLIARAEELLLSGRSIDGATALAWGLANGLADNPTLLAEQFFEKHLAGKSAAALAHATRAAREPFADLARARLEDVEALYLEKLMATRDANEGLQAFIDKRAPRWEHR